MTDFASIAPLCRESSRRGSAVEPGTGRAAMSNDGQVTARYSWLMEALTPRIPEFAYYYGDWIWDEELTGWIKSLLLFFDGVAMALPSERAERRIEANPVLTQPLAELGLLRNYDPSTWLKPIQELSEEEDRQLEQAAEILDLIYDDSDESHRKLVSVLESIEPMREFALRLARGQTAADDSPYSLTTALLIRTMSIWLQNNISDVAIQPVIDNEDAASFVSIILGLYAPGRAKIVVGDLAQVGIDLSAVPLDEVLGFRAEYGSEYRTYSSDVRRFALELSLMGAADQGSALTERREELEDRAEQLRRIALTAFARQAISFGFGFAGAAWTLVHGDAWGAAFAAGAATAGITRRDPGAIGAAYTYILRAKTELAR